MDIAVPAGFRVRFFYGWLIVAVAFLANLVGVGITTYAFGVLLRPMSEDLGWSRAMIVGATTVAGIVGGVASPWVGRLVDRGGERWVMVVSALLGGAVLLALSQVGSLWQFYFLFGLGIGLTRPGLEGLAGTVTVANWFIKRRGRALAVASAGASLGAAVLVPVTQRVVAVAGWRAAWTGLGLLKWGILILPAALLVRHRPEEMGLRPDGEASPADSSNSPRHREVAQTSAEEVDWEAHDALRSPSFWLLLSALTLTGVALSGTVLHVVAHYMDRGLSPATAAQAMSSFSLAALVTKAFWGFLTERLHIRYCIMLMAFWSAVGIALIMSAQRAEMAFLASIVWGLGVGSTGQLQGQVWPDYFGRGHLGTIRGYANFFQIAGNAGAPLLSAWVFDVTGSYQAAFSLFIASCLLAVLVMYLARPPAAHQMAGGGVRAAV